MAFSSHKTPVGLASALSFFRRASRRKLTEEDRPPASTWPGKKPQHVDGQLALLEEKEVDDAA
jgi:hypothetical protein